MDDTDVQLMEMHNPALRWHGWGSPIGMGLFLLLVSAAVALLRLAAGRERR